MFLGGFFNVLGLELLGGGQFGGLCKVKCSAPNALNSRKYKNYKKPQTAVWDLAPRAT